MICKRFNSVWDSFLMLFIARDDWFLLNFFQQMICWAIFSFTKELIHSNSMCRCGATLNVHIEVQQGASERGFSSSVSCFNWKLSIKIQQQLKAKGGEKNVSQIESKSCNLYKLRKRTWTEHTRHAAHKTLLCDYFVLFSSLPSSSFARLAYARPHSPEQSRYPLHHFRRSFLFGAWGIFALLYGQISSSNNIWTYKWMSEL